MWEPNPMNVMTMPTKIWLTVPGAIWTIAPVISNLKINSNISTKLVHISTDQVYNNSPNHIASSENNINPSNGYGVTKYLGELAALKYKNTIDYFYVDNYQIKLSWN